MVRQVRRPLLAGPVQRRRGDVRRPTLPPLALPLAPAARLVTRPSVLPLRPSARPVPLRLAYGIKPRQRMLKLGPQELAALDTCPYLALVKSLTFVSAPRVGRLSPFLTLTRLLRCHIFPPHPLTYVLAFFDRPKTARTKKSTTTGPTTSGAATATSAT